MDLENEQVVFIEFHDNEPYSATTHEKRRGGIGANEYDLAVSKRFGLLYHLCGFSGIGDCTTITLHQPLRKNEDGSISPAEVIYWAAPGITVTGLEVYKRLETLPEPYKLETMFDGLHAINCDYGILWCSRCKDFMPDYSPDYCEHIWYCEKCEEASMPGERCRHRRS